MAMRDAVNTNPLPWHQRLRRWLQPRVEQNDANRPEPPVSTWASAHPEIIRHASGIAWRLPLTVSHGEQIKLVIHATCMQVTIERLATEHYPAQTLKRTLQKLEGPADVKPQAHFADGYLVVAVNFNNTDWQTSGAQRKQLCRWVQPAELSAAVV